MAVNANKVRTIVDEVAKFKKEEIEFLFETIKNGMIPGKHLGIAMEVVNKLKSQYQLLNRKEARINETKSKKDVVKQQIEDIQQEELLEFEIMPEKICNYGVVLAQNDSLNAYADGNNLYLTTGMLRFVDEDRELQFILAHELSMTP